MENVEKNKGMRAIAKIMLDSLWGKLAQRENMTKTEYMYISESSDSPGDQSKQDCQECGYLQRKSSTSQLG